MADEDNLTVDLLETKVWDGQGGKSVLKVGDSVKLLPTHPE